MSRASFRFAAGSEFVPFGPQIEVLVVDDEAGLELWIMTTGEVRKQPFVLSVAHYRASPLWEEVK